jgi:serine aminopeptidase S33 family
LTSATQPAPAAGLSGAETPLFFDSGGRPLFAVYHAPALPRPGAPVIVQCHSVGVEHVASYRFEVQAARAAATVGFPVFRHHASGHGDSTGDFADVTLESLVADALAARDEALKRSGATRVLWAGLRLGALVAACARERAGEAAGLALWAPVHRPMDYYRGQLRGLLYGQVAEGQKPSATVDQLLAEIERVGRVDVHGYYLHRPLVESTRQESLAGRLAGWAGPTFLAQVGGVTRLSPDNAALAQTLEARDPRLLVCQVGPEPGWHFYENPPWQCPPLIAAYEAWLRALA